MSRTATRKGENVSTIQAAARLGAALKDGPLTMYGAALIVAGVDDCGWHRLQSHTQEHYRSKARGLIDAFSYVGGLQIAEDTQGDTTIYFLLSG